MVRFLQSQGFSVTRIRSSHYIRSRGELRTTVPVHGNETLKIGTLRAILRDVDLGANDFIRLWGV
jgi:predicted RNA binding protein YcfA (HicA-like mRNA interferase family)